MTELRLPIYLDSHSTTQVDPRVVEAMVPYFSEHYGNAASRHHEFGWRAEAAVELSRKHIGALIGAATSEIVFTSGATESINLALKGIAESAAGKGNHIITVQTEHRAVLDTCKRLEQRGYTVTFLAVDRHGVVAPEDVQNAMSEKTILVSVMMANNEIGTIEPAAAIGRMCRERGVIFHTDATQAVGKIPVDVRALHVDLVSFSAHKMYGPKGVGALYIRNARPRIGVAPQLDGGGHEGGVRSGTLNVPAIVGFGKAAAIAQQEMAGEAERVRALRNRLLDGLTSTVEDIRLNGHPTERLPNNANLTFEGVRADRLMMSMKEIALSSGSACSSVSPEPSHVLRAIGLRDEEVVSSIRFGLGRFTTEQEIDYTIARVAETVEALRKTSQIYRLTH